MPSTDTTIRVVHSEDLTFTSVISLGGSVVNLEDCTLYFTAKWQYSDTDADAVFQLTNDAGITITNPSAGAISITIPDSATSGLPYAPLRLFYDLLVLTSASLRGYPLRGILIISPNVTRT